MVDIKQQFAVQFLETEFTRRFKDYDSVIELCRKGYDRETIAHILNLDITKIDNYMDRLQLSKDCAKVHHHRSLVILRAKTIIAKEKELTEKTINNIKRDIKIHNSIPSNPRHSRDIFTLLNEFGMEFENLYLSRWYSYLSDCSMAKMLMVSRNQIRAMRHYTEWFNEQVECANNCNGDEAFCCDNEPYYVENNNLRYLSA
jgi:hypothetical protein